MEYAVVRVVHNADNYQSPSGGKLGKNSESSYAKTSGFGHEEWNFNRSLLTNGRVNGYHYYKPAEKKRRQPFTLFFTTYTDKQWKLVGIYQDAVYCDQGSPTTPLVLKQKLKDLRALGDELGAEWASLTDAQIIKKLKQDVVHMRWSVDPEDIVVPPTSLEIPLSMVFEKDFRKNYHETTATTIAPSDARLLESLLGKSSTRSKKSVDSKIDSELPDVETDAIEGQQKLVAHLKRERSPKLVKAKKRSVYHATGMLACEVCAFDFNSIYGPRGHQYCEVHHLKKLSEIKESSVTTRLSDLAVVCSNCHRMLHRGVPMLTLKKLVAQMEAAKQVREKV